MKRTFSPRSRKSKRQLRGTVSNSGSKALAGSISGFCRVLAVSAITALGLGEARAATLFWDPNGGGSLGGNGFWDTTTPQWWNGVTDSVWNNSLNNEAVFPFSTTGTFVSVGEHITAGALTFSVGGYSLSGFGNSITIASTGPNPATKAITVTHAGDIATITVELRGTGGFTKAGAGTLILDGDSTGASGITGGVTLAGGKLVLDFASQFSPGILKSQALTITSTATFQFTAASGGTNLSLGALTFSGGEGTVSLNAFNILSDVATLTFSSLSARAAGATGSFVQNGTGANNTKIVLTGQAAGFMNQGLFFTDGFGNNNFAYYDAGGFVRGINYGVDANTATQAGSAAGIAPANANKHVRVTADVTGQGNLTVLTLNLAGSSFTANGGILQNPGTTITLTNAGILKSGGGIAPIAGGTIAAGANELIIRTDAVGDALNISSVVTGSGGLTKSGLGSLQLNPQTAGALSLGGSSTLAGSNAITLASTAPAGLVPGMPAFGPGIPANTTISSISGNSVTLSNPVTVTSAAPLSYDTTVGGGSNIVNLTSAQAGTLTVGQPVSGTNIAPNTTIFAINVGTGNVTLSASTIGTASLQTITFSGATLAFGSTQNFSATAGPLNNDHATSAIGSTTLTLRATIPALVAGMSVDGPGITPGTTIASVAGTNVTLSQVATASSSPVKEFTATVGGGSQTINLTPAQASQLFIGSLVSGTNIQPNTFITGINLGNGQVTIGLPTTGSPSVQNLVFGGATLAFGTSTLTLSPAQAANLVVGSTVTGVNITPGTTILAIDTGTGVVSLSAPTSGTASAQFLTFGGATAVNINSTYGGLTRINAGVFAASSAGIPAGGTVTIGGGAEFAAVNSIITNNLTFTGGGAALSGAGGNGGGFSGTITAGENDFQLLARDYSSSANANLNISGTINGSGTMTIPTGSGGIVTLSGDNSGAGGFSGPVVIETGAKLSIARLQALAKGNAVTTSGTLILALDGNGGAAYAGGNGTGAPQTLTFAQPINVTMISDATVQPDRDGTAYGGLFRSAANKTVQLGSLTLGNLTLTAQNNAGSGVDFTGTVSMTDLFNPGVFNVVNPTASNAVQGLTFSGIVSGAVTGSVNTVLQKIGNGTLVLSNSGNTFGGARSAISIVDGVIAVASNGALGNALNTVNLNWDGTGSIATLRATNTFSTSRTIFANTASLNAVTNPTVATPQNGIEVTVGNIFTVDAPFGLPAGFETNGIVKNDNGTLLITANNGATVQSFAPSVPIQQFDQTITLTPSEALSLPLRGTTVTGAGIAPGTTVTNVDVTTGIVTLSDAATGPGSGNVTFNGAAWSGPVRINAGAVRVQTTTALGTGSASSVTVAQTGAAFQIAGGVTIANRLFLTGTGIGSTGALQGRGAVTNTASGQIVMTGATTIGSNAGSTLNITGGITGSQALTFNNAGTVNITTTPLDPTYSFSGDVNFGTNLIQNIPNTDSIVVGQVLSDGGAGYLAANTTVTAKTATTVTININATGTQGGAAFTSKSAISSLTKAGVGTLTLGVNSPGFLNAINVNEGTLRISGNGVAIGNPSAANTTLVQGPSGVLLIDDTGATPTLHMGSGVYTATVGGGATTLTLTPAQAATVTTFVPVFGANIAPGSFVTAVNTTTGVVTLNLPTTGSASPQSLTFGSNRNLQLTGGKLTYNGGAGASVETFGTLSVSRGPTNVVASNPGSGSVSLFFKTLTINGDGNLDFQGAGLGAGSNTITFTQTNPGTTNSIIQRATLNGTDFVSYNTTGAVANTNGIQAFANYNTSNVFSGTSTATFDLTTDPTFTAAATINAFRISGSFSATGAGTQGTALTLSAGAILVPSGNPQVNFPIILFGAQPFVYVNAGASLSIGSLLSGGSGFVKAGEGTLTLTPIAPNRAGIPNLSGQTLNGNFSVNGGKLILGGGNNTLTPNQYILVATGATLDLNGTFQFAFGTTGDGATLSGNAGTYTNSSASPAALILGLDGALRNFGGVITQDPTKGAMSFLKSSNQTYNFYSASTYSGTTQFSGGINEFRDGGSLPNTSSIVLNYARLALNDNNTFALPNRLNAAAPISMRGGSLSYSSGRAQTETTQTVGSVTLLQGQNMIQSAAGGTGVNSAVLTLASLTRGGNLSATVRFPDVVGSALNGGGLGAIGSTGRIVITSPPTLSADLIGPWAVVDREFASYIPTLGVGALNQTGFAGYSTNFLNRQPLATDNIRATLGVPGLAVDTTVNTLTVNTNVAAVAGVPVPTIIDLGGKKLTLAGGGMILALNGDNQNITVQNGTITSTGPGVGGGSDLYLHQLNYGGNNRTFIVSAGITDNGTGSVRLIEAAGAADTAITSANADFLMLSGTNTYTGGTVVNGGTLVIGATGNIPAAAVAANGLIINGGEVSGVGNVYQNPGGTIAASNVATVNGLAALTLAGDNTLAGLILNNLGGGNIAPTVTTFRSLTPLGTGTLTLGTAGIVASAANPSAQSLVAGRIDFGGGLSTVNVGSYNFGTFTDFAPTTAGLILQGVTGSVGGFNKTGTGVLQFNAQAAFTGPVNVNAGGLQIGVTNGGSRFSAVTLAAGTRLNLNGFSTTLGSLSGSGTVTNVVANTQTLTVGFDNSNTTFSGQFSRFNDQTPAAVVLVKVGTGTMTITSAQNALSGSSGGVTVNGGGLTYSGAGKAYPSTPLSGVTYTVSATGTLTIDNAAVAADDRLGLNAANGTVTLTGGTLAMIGNAAGSSETVNILNFGNGGSTILLTPGAGGATAITVTGSVSDKAGQDSVLITGNGLGGSGAGSVNVIVNGTFNAIGSGGGPQTLQIRPDMIGDASGGLGTGFITRTGGNLLRPLDQLNELATDMVQATGGALTPNANVGLTSVNNSDPAKNKLFSNQTINSLTLLGAGTPTLTSGHGAPAGVYGPTGGPLTLTVTSGGFLALGNATIGIGAIASPSGATQYFHVVGGTTNLDLNGSITAGNAGIVKAADGTLTLNAPQFYTGTAGTNGTTINGGTLKLNAGNNTILLQPTGNVATALGLFLNGGTLDLNGNNQVVERLTNVNPLPGAGGTVINSGGVTVTLTTATNTSTVFSGSIGTGVPGANNAINLINSGNSTLTLTNVNTYTGTTLIRGGTLELRDSGTLETSAVNVNFGTLFLNQGGLNPASALNPIRIPSTSLLTLNGGTVSQSSAGSVDSSATFNNVNLASGANIFTQSTLQNAGSSAMISIGSLVQQSPGATVSFASTNGTLGGGGLNNNQVQIASITPSGGGAASPASLLVNGMLPAWMTVGGTEFAGYLSSPVAGSQGIGAFTSAGFPTYSTSAPAIAHAADNLSVTASVLPIAGRTVNSLAIRNPGAATVVPINLPTDTLSIATGGVLVNSGQTISIQGGRLTAGSVANAPGTLYVTTTGSGAITVNSQLVNNGNQLYSANTDGFSNIVTVGSTSGLIVGQAISGPGIPVGATITAIATTGQPFAPGVVQTINPNNPSGPTNASTVPISAAAAFTFSAPTGASIPAATFTVTDLQKANSFTTGGSNAVFLANVTSLAVGMYASGPGIPAGTIITALGTPQAPTTITLSNNATQTLAPQTFILSAGNNSNLITMQPGQISALAVGMVVSGIGVPLNTTVTNISGNTATLSAPVSGATSLRSIAFQATLNFARLGINEAMRGGSINAGATVIAVNNTTGLANGMTVTGNGIQPGTKIVSISGTNVTLSLPVTSSSNGVNLIFGSSISVGNNTTGDVPLVKTGTGTLTLSPQVVMNGGLIQGTNVIALETVTGLTVGMPVIGAGIPAGATIASISTANNAFNITINGGNATAGGASQISFGLGLNNTYTGGTFVNQGTLNLAGLAGTTVIPGNIEINNATVSTQNIAITAATVNAGNGTITLPNVTGLSLGMRVIGNGIPVGSTVTAIAGNNITITNAAGVIAGTNIALSFGNSGQIVSTSNVTINGGGVFNLFGANTLGNITINNIGGSAAPTVALGTAGMLTLTNGISVTNDSLSFTPVISGTGSTLVLANSTITTAGASPQGLLVSVPITPGTSGGTLVKTGIGSLILTPSFALTGTTANSSNQVTMGNPTGLSVGMAVSGLNVPVGTVISAINTANNTITLSANTNASGAATGALTFTGNTFTGGVNLSEGSIILGANSTPSTVGATVTSGPLGTGPLNMANGTALLSDGTLRTISNAVNIAVNAVFGTLGNGAATAGNGVILAGTVTLIGGGTHAIEVNGLLNTTTISGVLNGGGTALTLNKTGAGTLVLSNGANAYAPATTTTINVNGGVLKLGAATAVPAGLNLTVAQGAAYDISGQNNQILLALNGGGMVTNSGALQTLFIGGTSTSDTTSNVNATFDGTLTEATVGNLRVTKVGIGTQTLNGASSYTGNTTISAGKLIVNGSLANTNVIVGGGSLFAGSLGGTGSIGNSVSLTSVTVNGGTGGGGSARGAIDLTNGSIGTLTLTTQGTGNALAIGSGGGLAALLNFDVANTTTDRISITGTAKLLVNSGGGIVNLTQLPTTSLATGIYSLITFSGVTYTGTFSAGSVNGGAVGTGLVFANGWKLSTSGTSSLQLIVGGVTQTFFWTGAQGTVWNTNSGGTNWVDAVSAGVDPNDIPNATSIVNFKASGGVNTATTLGQDFTIDQLIFNNSATVGAVSIGGANVLTLNNNLQMLAGAGSASIGTSGLVLGGIQAWIIQSSTDLTVTAPMSGSSALSITTAATSTGKVVLGGDNSAFTGGFTIAGNGTNTAVQLGAASTNALGPVAGPNPLVVNTGALDLNGKSVTISSLSSNTTGGIIRNSLASSTSTLTVNQNTTTTYSGAIQDTGSGGTAGKIALAVTGGGTLTLITATNTFSGGTTITNATVRMGTGASENQSSLGTGLVTINAGGVLAFAPGSNTTNFNIPNSFVLNGGAIQSTGGNQHLANTGSSVGTITVTTGTGGTLTPTTTAGQDLWVDGQLTGDGPLSVGGSGTGRVILTNNLNAATYTGTLTTSGAGSLRLANASGTNSTVLGGASLVNNANGLSFGGTVTTATIGSIAGSGSFALQNSAGAPAGVALTVGGNATSTTYTGIISNSASTILGSLIKVGNGTLTLGGLNTYRGTTTVDAGALRVNNNSVVTSVTGFGAVTVNGTATLGGNGLIQGGNNVTPGSVTLNSGTFLDPGLSPTATGTLRFGPSGASPQPTTLTLSANSTFNFDVGAGAGNQDRVLVVGSVNITGAKLAINLLSTPDQGKYTLMDATVSRTGTFTGGITTGGNISGGVTNNLPTGYQLVYNASSVDLQRFGQLGTPTTPGGLQVITGGSVPFTFEVANTAPTGSADLSFTATSGTRTTGSVSTPVVVSAQTTGSGTGLSFDSTAVPIGLGQTGNFTVTAPGATGSPAIGTVAVDVLDHASFAGFTGGTLNLGNIRQGYANVVTSINQLNVTNVAGTRVDLKGSAAPNGLISLSSVSGVQAGLSGAISASLALGQGLGPISQGFTYTFGDDSTLNGNSPTLPGSASITVIGNVYSGIGVWGPMASGAWGDFTRWTSPGGYPGLDGSLSINDTATFNSNVTGPVVLDSVAPALNQVNLNGVTGTIAQGAGANSLTLVANGSAVNPSVNVNGGTPTISAPLVLQNTITFTTANMADTLTVSGPVSDLSGAGKGPAGIIKTGNGTMFLTGTNGYTGKTTIAGGTLSVPSDASLGAVPPSLPVPDQFSISNGATLAFTGNATLALSQGITMGSGGGNISVDPTRTVVVSGALSGSGTLTKTGGGTLDLRNTTSGVAGRVVLQQGTLTPFAGTPATITTGGLTFSGGTLAIDIHGTTGQGNPGGYDFIFANNNGATPSVNITAPTNLTINYGGFVPNPNNPDVFTIITDATRQQSDLYASTFYVNGTPFLPNVPTNINGQWFTINYYGGAGGDIILTSVVPEPGTGVLLLGAVGLLGIMRRRRPRKVPFGV